MRQLLTSVRQLLTSVRLVASPVPSLAQGTQASLAVAGSQLAEQWSEEPHVMVCFQVHTSYYIVPYL